MHELLYEDLVKLNVEIILEDKVLIDGNTHVDFDGHVQEKRIITMNGKRIECDLLLLCTGQKPNTELMAELSPLSVDNQSGLVKVTRSMQLAEPILESYERNKGNNNDVNATDNKSYKFSQRSLEATKIENLKLKPSKLSNIFVVGDSADAFGAIKAGRYGWFQAQTASENILKLIKENDEEPSNYYPDKPSIKISIGLTKSIILMDDKITINDKVPVDLDVASIWKARNANTEDMSL